AVSLAAYNTGLPDAALTKAARDAIDRALAINPGWDRAALLKSDILARSSTTAAIEFLEDFTRRNPEAKPAFGALAQFYVEQKRYADARRIFEKLWNNDPSAREFEFGAA